MSKYTEWIDSLPDDEKQHEMIWRELYTKIGCVIHNAQLLEYNLCVLLIYNQVFQKIKTSKNITLSDLENLDKDAEILYEKLKKMTMGQIASNIDGVDKLKEDHKEEIKHIIKERNNIVHNVFKDRLKDNWFKKHDNIDILIEQYNSFVKKIIGENKYILKLIAFYKKRVMQMFS